MSAQLASNVIPFRGGASQIATTPQIGSDLRIEGGQNYNDRLAELVAAIEGLSSQLVAERALRAQSSAFGAVYISALTPDAIPHAAMRRLRALAHIEDRSDHIDFEDGLE